MEKHKTVAIILAAGQGKRMNSSIQKQYLLIKGKPVIFYSLDVFQNSFIDEIILVVSQGEVEYCQQEIVNKFHFTKVSKIVEGGKERYHSVSRGLQQIEDSDYIFIHDGARPFINQEILARSYKETIENRACVVGMPVKDTIKIVDKNKYAIETPQREKLWLIQTPQIFESKLIIEAYRKLLEAESAGNNYAQVITDDAMVVEIFEKVPVRLVKGSYNNIKITTPEDLKIAEALL